MHILRKRKLAQDKPWEYFESLDENTDYSYLSLSDLWEDTCVSGLYMHQEVIQGIYGWAEKSLSLKPSPEVGGFLWGSYSKKENEFVVSMEKFFPSEKALFSNSYRLEFGYETLIEMDNLREVERNLNLIGWFHTHPGHGPFLSQLDITTHECAFEHAYQLAIVTDPKTPNFETGIFSRKQSDQNLNNKNTDSNWISWKSILPL